MTEQTQEFDGEDVRLDDEESRRKAAESDDSLAPGSMPPPSERPMEGDQGDD